MRRITREQAFMETAIIWSKRSTCYRLNVGCIIVYQNQIIAQGYNGATSGDPHCSGNTCRGVIMRHCETSLHAEINTINKIPDHLKNEPLRMYVTHSPCEDCVTEINKTSIIAIYFRFYYRDTEALKKLNCRAYQLGEIGQKLDVKRGVYEL